MVPGEREIEVIQALHACFFEDACLVPMGARQHVGTAGSAAPRRAAPVSPSRGSGLLGLWVAARSQAERPHAAERGRPHA